MLSFSILQIYQPPHLDSELDGNDYETDQDNETRLAIKKTKAVYGKLNAATAHEEPKDTHKSNSDITTKKDAADLSNQKSSEKRQQKEQWFLSKLKESFPDETIRLSVPKSLRHTTDQCRDIIFLEFWLWF